MANGRIRALLVEIYERNDYRGIPHIEWAGTVVTATPAAGALRNVAAFMYEDASDSKHALDDGAFEDFKANVVAAGDFNDHKPYGREIGFYPNGRVHQGHARRFIKVLDHLERYDRKQDGLVGPAESIGAWFARLATGVGASHVILKYAGNGHLHSDNEYRAYKPGDAAWRINQTLENWRSKIEKGEVVA